jgi:hypothetical protein
MSSFRASCVASRLLYSMKILEPPFPIQTSSSFIPRRSDASHRMTIPLLQNVDQNAEVSQRVFVEPKRFRGPAFGLLNVMQGDSCSRPYHRLPPMSCRGAPVAGREEFVSDILVSNVRTPEQ